MQNVIFKNIEQFTIESTNLGFLKLKNEGIDFRMSEFTPFLGDSSALLVQN